VRDGLAWSLGRLRTWVALAAACAATAMASSDGRSGWTVTVAVVTFGLAALSMRAHWLDGHPEAPGRAERRRARHEALVAASLARYQGVPGGSPRSRGGRHESPATGGMAAWAVRSVGTWASLAFAAALALWRPLAGAAAFVVVAVAVRVAYVTTHPDRPTREQRRDAKYEEWVAKTLREYRDRPPSQLGARRLVRVDPLPSKPLPVPPAEPARAGSQDARVEAIRSALKPPSAPE